jgi:cell wall-associated NlpC family hydrolase
MTMSTTTQAKARRGEGRYEPKVRRRLSAAAAVLALVLAGSAAASRSASKVPVSWAAPQIQAVTAQGLMGTSDPATFRPNQTLTAQALAGLAFGLQQVLAPPPTEPVEPVTPVAPVTPTVPTTTDPTVTDPTMTAPTDTTPTPEPDPAPAEPPTVANPDAPATMTQLDAKLVASLGLSGAASEFVKGARAAGLKVPARFGTEVVARLLGLRLNHPADQDGLELRPQDPATRAEAAYSAAQILGFGVAGGTQVMAVQALADSFALPALSSWQTRILDVAVSKIGMPYIWGGTSDGAEDPFGVHSRGGYDCSGFVWRVYKLQRYAGEGDLASVIRGRTTFVMSVEVPQSERIGYADLQPGDVLFFGAAGPRSQSAQVDHTAIYLGNNWFIQSSNYGVAVTTLTGYYKHTFAWARRPLAEAGLSG